MLRHNADGVSGVQMHMRGDAWGAWQVVAEPEALDVDVAGLDAS